MCNLSAAALGPRLQAPQPYAEEEEERMESRKWEHDGGSWGYARDVHVGMMGSMHRCIWRATWQPGKWQPKSRRDEGMKDEG